MEWLGDMETGGTPPSPRKGHSMTRLLDSPLVLVFGGEHPSGRLLNDMYCLNVDTRSWRKVFYADAAAPPPRILHSATAISSTTLVVMCGDAVPEGSPANASPTPMGDVWCFDIRTSAWREIKKNESTPPARSCHSAVFGNVLGQVPAIYVFGGFGRGEPEGSAMYRLRIGDWKWECLPILITDLDGRERIVEKPVATTSEEGDATGKKDQFPSQRESHGAIWLPAKNGMLIVGGDGGFAVVDDAWLFVPSSQCPGAWRWRNLKLRMARDHVKNKLPLCAGSTLVALPTAKTQVLMWGGIEGASGEQAMGATYSYLLDLDAMQTTCLTSSGEAPSSGRLLHGFVRVGNLLLTFGGCDSDGNVLQGLQYAKLRPDLKSVGLQATDFGPAAAEVAAGIESPLKREDLDIDKQDSEADHQEDEDMNVPLVGPSSIPKGTPLSGRIIGETDYGFFVSVVINGKLYKGVLVANPLKSSEVVQGDAATDKPSVATPGPKEETVPTPDLREKPSPSSAPKEKKTPTHDPKEKLVETKVEESPLLHPPEPKRMRLDPAVESLPDAPPRPVQIGANEVIELLE